MEKDGLVKKRILENLKHTYCRIMPSKLGGVGVFAVRNIPKGTNPFEILDACSWHKFAPADLEGLDEEVLRMIDDFFVVEKDGTVYIPQVGLNGLNISYFLNHSTQPNVEVVGDAKDEATIFKTIREIKKGEELMVSYASFDEKWK